MTTRLVTVFGGSGFIGRHLVQRLAARGWRVRVAVRDPDGAAFLSPLGDVGQIIPLYADITNKASVAAVVDGAHWVVNAVGILTEHGRSNFQSIHVDGAGNIAAAAAAAGVKGLAQISAIGADAQSPAAYARSKAAAEEAVLAAFPTAVILRPSVVFGPEDDFFNRFATMTSFSPILPVIVTRGFSLLPGSETTGCPLFGNGGPRLQPVYVGDVADAIFNALSQPAWAGKIFELGGPEVLSLKQILEMVLRATGRRRILLPLPLAVARIQAQLMRILPNPPLTTDQIKLLSIDNVVSDGALGLADLGIAATAAESVVSRYLGRFRNPYAPAA
ncbi:complex I NDUFA9 subunit family protein [Telmatospirillum sp.]|uniref:complex I NDUFA9 subunit family protein n=1 Tax=Telmatospirillum sp. TaxID=2079197 RepID=UPI002840D3F7|nr:complex I NDUFA9 subunit family protein [Telmatospirillum sp.]MDR3439545.1 complex I NDUFA9 subunit family protein [Telmatospirillum sp.]